MATIQGVYVALFGRPADPTGLTYFNSVTKNGADLSGIGDLAGSQEYKDRFAGQNNVQIVNSIYRSLFNRDADITGLNFFVNGLNNGTFKVNDIAIRILDGATGSDKTIVDTKVAAADLYTKSLDTGAEVVAYSGNAAAAQGRAFLAPIATTAPTQAQVDAAVATMVTAGNGGGTGNAGVILTLTGAADALTPTAALDQNKTTAGNDTIRGLTAAALESADIVDGGAGTDTLNGVLSAAAGTVKPVLTSVENINLAFIGNAAARTLAGTVVFDAGDTNGANKITVSDAIIGAAANELTVSNAAKSTVIAFQNISVTDGNAGTGITGVLNAGFRDVAGGADAATVSLQGITGVTAAPADVASLVVAGIETLTLNSSVAANTVLLTAAAAKALVITGDQALTLTGTGNAALKSVDATAFTGVLTYTAGALGETITTGTKADIITLNNAGNDVVVYNATAKSTLNALDRVNSFDFTNDKVDVKAFALGADTTVGTTALAPAGDTAGFFTGTQRVMINETAGPGGTAMIYVDVNKDGVFNAASDLAINLVGATAANFTAADLTLA